MVRIDCEHASTKCRLIQFEETMPSLRFTPFSIFLLLAVFNVREIGGAKCTFSFVQGAAVCNNVNSFREVAVEMRSTWISVKINNRLGGSFAMVLTGMTWQILWTKFAQ